MLRKKGGGFTTFFPLWPTPSFQGGIFFVWRKKNVGIIEVFAKEDHKVGDLFLKTNALLRSTQPSRRMEITLGFKQNSTSKPGSSVSDFPATRPARSAPCPTPGCSSPSAPSGWNWCGCSELLHRTPGTPRSAVGTGRWQPRSAPPGPGTSPRPQSA